MSITTSILGAECCVTASGWTLQVPSYLLSSLIGNGCGFGGDGTTGPPRPGLLCGGHPLSWVPGRKFLLILDRPCSSPAPSLSVDILTYSLLNIDTQNLGRGLWISTQNLVFVTRVPCPLGQPPAVPGCRLWHRWMRHVHRENCEHLQWDWLP